VSHAGHADVADELALAAQEAVILTTPNRAAE
jgi:hypothetical protein